MKTSLAILALFATSLQLLFANADTQQFNSVLKQAVADMQVNTPAKSVSIDLAFSIDGAPLKIFSIGRIDDADKKVGQSFLFENGDLQLEVAVRIVAVSRKSVRLWVQAVSGTRYLEAKHKNPSEQTRLYSAFFTGELLAKAQTPAKIIDYRYSQTTEKRRAAPITLSDVFVVLASFKAE